MCAEIGNEALVDAPLTTGEDHDRVMALPAYRRWYDKCDRWEDRWRWRQEARASKMREREYERHQRALAKIDEWKDTNASRQAAHAAWKIEDDRRYWPLRRV